MRHAICGLPTSYFKPASRNIQALMLHSLSRLVLHMYIGITVSRFFWLISVVLLVFDASSKSSPWPRIIAVSFSLHQIGDKRSDPSLCTSAEAIVMQSDQPVAHVVRSQRVRSSRPLPVHLHLPTCMYVYVCLWSITVPGYRPSDVHWHTCTDLSFGGDASKFRLIKMSTSSNLVRRIFALQSSF